MTEPAVHPNQKRLDTLRMRASLASQEWGVAAIGDRFMLTAGRGDGAEMVAVIEEKASFDNKEFLLSLPADHLWLIERYTELAARFRELSKKAGAGAPKPKDFARDCAIKCNDRLFLRYLMECHQLIDQSDAERINTRVRFILDIQSRAELNTDPAAAGRWEKLLTDFFRWRKA